MDKVTAAESITAIDCDDALTFFHKIEYIRIDFLESVFAAFIVQSIECIEQCLPIQCYRRGVIASGHNQFV